MKKTKTTFFVYKKGKLYLSIDKNPEPGKMFVYNFVKDIDKASYWEKQKDAKSWYLEEKYPDIELIPCGLIEKRKTKKL
jgi:hypothetical protein